MANIHSTYTQLLDNAASKYHSYQTNNKLVNKGLSIKEVKTNMPDNMNPQIWNDAKRYGGYRNHGNGSSTDVNILTSNKNKVTFKSKHEDLAYMEISSVKGVHNDALARQLHQQIMTSKLTSKSMVNAFKPNQHQGQIKLEYGVSEFFPNTMYNSQKGGNNSHLHLDISTLKAQIQVFTGNNRINMNFDYTEEVDMGTWGDWGKSPFETFEEYDLRVEREMRRGPISQSDYRSVNINYSARRNLSSQDARTMNEVNQFLLKMAESGANKRLNNSNAEITDFIERMKQKGVSIKLNLNYHNYGSSKAKMSLSLMNGQSNVNVKVEKEVAANQNRPITERFWS